MMDYDGLKMLANYHEYVALRKKIADEKDWLKQSRQSCGELGINIDKSINISGIMYGAQTVTTPLLLYRR